jgi:hypothetical protein
MPIWSFQKSVTIGMGKSAARSALETTSKDALRTGFAVVFFIGRRAEND